MEPPARFESREVRDENVKVLRAIPPFEEDTADGVAPSRPGGGSGASARRATARRRALNPQSNTETFVAMRVTGGQLALVGYACFYLRTGEGPPRRGDRGVVIKSQAGAPPLPFASTAVETVHPTSWRAAHPA